MDTRAIELQLLTVPQAAERLGLKESTIRMWLLKRRLAKVVLSKRAIRIRLTEVERLITEGSVPARVCRP